MLACTETGNMTFVMLRTSETKSQVFWKILMRVYAMVRYPLILLALLLLMMWTVGNIKNGHAVPWDQPSVTENISELYVNESTEAMQRKEYDVGFHSEKEQMRAEMVEIVDCLYQLTASVNNPAPHDRYMLMKETFDVSKYEQLETENILRNFPSIQPELAARLGQANTRRRQYLSNRRAIYREGQNWSAASFTASIEDVTFPQIDDRKPGICPCCFMLFTPGLLRDESWQYVAL